MDNDIKYRENAQELVDYFTEHPDRHNQASWVDGISGIPLDKPVAEVNLCGTSMCIAGAAVFLDSGIKGLVECQDTLDADLEGHSDFIWEQRGAEFLGLTEDEAKALFYNFNEESALDMVRAVAQGDETKFWALKKSYDEQPAELYI